MGKVISFERAKRKLNRRYSDYELARFNAHINFILAEIEANKTPEERALEEAIEQALEEYEKEMKKEKKK